MIGLTGGIGSGKSTVAKLFAKLGIPIYNSDYRAREIMNSNPTLIGQIKALFGDDIYDDQGFVLRSKLAQIVFHNATKLQQLNALVHPAVKEDSKIWEQSHKEAAYLVKESAILFETGIYKDMRKNILVVAPEELRIERVMQRDHVSREDVLARISKQMSDKEKISMTDFIIENDGIHSLQLQVDDIHNQLVNL